MQFASDTPGRDLVRHFRFLVPLPPNGEKGKKGLQTSKPGDSST
jgi:hypothetical protein